jgi:uncharacterized protein YndB with AHSA1/START domain
MKDKSFTTTIVVDQTAKEVFDAINNVRGWWSEDVVGATDKLNEEFTYHYEDIHRAKIRIVEFVPDQKVVWHVVDNHFNFTKDKKEWTDTKIIFEIEKKGKKTQLRFTHFGLVPSYECYEICNDAWTNYIQGSLYKLITTGKGEQITEENGNEFQDKVKERL